jgi:hypothetical protein
MSEMQGVEYIQDPLFTMDDICPRCWTENLDGDDYCATCLNEQAAM